MAGLACGAGGGGVSPSDITLQIIKDVATKRGVSFADVMGGSREATINLTRQEAMYEVYIQRPNLSYPAIGTVFNRDHTTCLHGVRKHCERIGVQYAALAFMRNRRGLLTPSAFEVYGEAMRRAA